MLGPVQSGVMIKPFRWTKANLQSHWQTYQDSSLQPACVRDAWPSLVVFREFFEQIHGRNRGCSVLNQELPY